MNKINYKTGILSLLLFFVAWGCKDDDDELRIPHLEVGEELCLLMSLKCRRWL